MWSFPSPVAPAALPAVLLATVCLAACARGATPGSAPEYPAPGVRSVAAVDDMLTRQQIQRINAVSMEQLIQGRFNGVQVFRQGGDVTLKIRGDGEPLLVVNGSPAASIALLWAVDPNDVEQIEILKDSAASIYGLTGGNGVVRITTRIR